MSVVQKSKRLVSLGLLVGLAAAGVGPVSAAAAAQTGAVPSVAVPSAAVPSAPVLSAPVPITFPCTQPRPDPAVPTMGEPDGLSGESAALAQQLANAGVAAGVPARAQALALAAAMRESGFVPGPNRAKLFATRKASDLGGPGQTTAALDAAGFYAKLVATPGWATLAPSVAIQRVLGGADPFRYQATWSRAVDLFAQLANLDGAAANAAVATYGNANRRCLTGPVNGTGLPLLPMSGYAVATEADAAVLSTACGAPVAAATAGTVSIITDQPRQGPWLLSISDGNGLTTTYAHVTTPLVTDGQQVRVGQQIASVGDLGNVDRCALGFTVSDGDTEVPAARWLLDRAEPAQIVTQLPETSFRVASLNVLGSHLTAPGGGRSGYRSGPARMGEAIGMLERAGISVVGLQEFETPAANTIAADGDWQVHRATPNNRFRDGNTSGNGIAWRTDTWQLVTSSEFTVPWRVTLHMPVVTLKHRETGVQIVVIAVHNPASTRVQGNQAGARSRARGVEIDYINRIRAESGLPVFLAGDMNERREAFCGFAGAGMRAWIGGNGSPCQMPRYGGVDWVFGAGDTTFSAPVVDRSTRGRVTDHPLVYGTATVAPQEHVVQLH